VFYIPSVDCLIDYSQHGQKVRNVYLKINLPHLNILIVVRECCSNFCTKNFSLKCVCGILLSIKGKCDSQKMLPYRRDINSIASIGRFADIFKECGLSEEQIDIASKWWREKVYWH